MNRKPTTFRRMVAVALMLTLGSFQALLTTSAFAQSQKAAGELSIRGQVMLNGVSAISGATVFSDGTIKTGRDSSATVNLGKMGRVELAPESEMVVSFAEGNVGGLLRAGRATLNTPAGVSVSVNTADGTAVAEGKDASVLIVDVTCGTRVAATRGDAKVNAGNKVEYVAAGQEVSVGAQAGSGPRCARLLATAAAAGTSGAAGAAGLSAGAVAALIIAGVGGTVAGIVAASQSDSTNPGQIVVSQFRP